MQNLTYSDVGGTWFVTSMTATKFEAKNCISVYIVTPDMATNQTEKYPVVLSWFEGKKEQYISAMAKCQQPYL